MKGFFKNLKPTYQVTRSGLLLNEPRSAAQLGHEFRQGAFQPEDTYRRIGRTEWQSFASRWKRHLWTETIFWGVYALLFLAASLLVLHLGLFFVKRATDSRFWPSVPGKITGTQVDRQSDKILSYTPTVYYGYDVNGTTYQGSGVVAGPEIGSERWAQSVISRYPVESTCRVYYNPARPRLSLLEPGFAPQTFQMSALGTVFLYASIACGWLACRAPFKKFPFPDLPRPTRRSILIRFALAIAPIVLGAILVWGVL